jgi:hypothetical protein
MDAVSEPRLAGPLHPIDRGDLAAFDRGRTGRRAHELPGVPPCKRKGPHVSLLHIGIQCVTHLTPRIYRGMRFIRTFLPTPQLDRFPRLPALEGVS